MFEKFKKWWHHCTLVKIDYHGVSGYGVREGLLFHSYHNFKANKEDWMILGDAWFDHCITTKEKAEKFIQEQGRKEIMINIEEVK